MSELDACRTISFVLSIHSKVSHYTERSLKNWQWIAKLNSWWMSSLFKRTNFGWSGSNHHSFYFLQFYLSGEIWRSKMKWKKRWTMKLFYFLHSLTPFSYLHLDGLDGTHGGSPRVGVKSASVAVADRVGGGVWVTRVERGCVAAPEFVDVAELTVGHHLEGKHFLHNEWVITQAMSLSRMSINKKIISAVINLEGCLINTHLFPLPIEFDILWNVSLLPDYEMQR